MKSIRHNFLYNAILNVSKVLFPLVTAPYISRVLGPDGVGLFNFANTYAAYFAMVALLGIPTYGIREIAKCREDRDTLTRTLSELITISVISTVAVSLVYLITVASIPRLGKDAAVFLIIGTALYTAPLNIDWYYSGMEEFKYITLRSIIIKALGVAAMFLFVRTAGDLLVYVVINVLVGLLNSLWNYARLLKSGIRPRLVLTGLRRHLKPVFILFASAAAISIYTVLDVLMLGFMKTDSEVAYYTCASNISKMILAAITSFSAVAIPRISYYMQNGASSLVSEIINKSFSAVAFLAFPAAMGIACIAPTFAPLFYGDMFHGTIVPLQVMAFVIVAIGFNNLSGVQVLVSLGHDRSFLVSVLSGACTNFLLNLILIPRFGAVGAAAASIAAESMVLAVSMYFVYRDTFVRIDRTADMLKSFVIPFAFIPLAVLLSRVMDGWLLVAVFCVAGFCLYVAVQYLLRNSSLMLFRDALVSKLRPQETHNN